MGKKRMNADIPEKKKSKPDPVLLAAWILAIISAFFVIPDKEYVGYIDWRSLGILWGLMVVIQGLKENFVFEKIGEVLLKKVSLGWQLSAVLIFMCFFGSMFITNDVTLITFVPFAMMILHSSRREDLMIPVVVLQTVAANMGSMLTPVGNPQNLYLYGVTGMSIGVFLLTMLPYTLTMAALLGISILFLPGKNKPMGRKENFDTVKHFGNKLIISVYSALFLLALLSVLRIAPWYIAVIIIFLAVLLTDPKILFRADYILLLTFIGFFIFTGNMGRITAVKDMLGKLVEGREFYVAVVTSQFISNVPATLLLSDFTEDYRELLLGVNVGGLGTLIASMASLISYKFYSNAYQKSKGRYFIAFTLVNVLFLALLILEHLLL